VYNDNSSNITNGEQRGKKYYLKYFAELNGKRKQSKKKKWKPQFFFHDVDSNQAAETTPFGNKSPNKKDEDLEYFDNYIMGGTSKPKINKSQRHKHE